MIQTFHFYLRKDKIKKTGKCPIYLRITSNRKHKYLSTGLAVKQKYWNDQLERVRANHHNHIKLNKILRKKIEEAEKAFGTVFLEGSPTAERIKKEIVHNENTDFFAIADEYLKDLEKTKKYYTRRAAKVAFRKLEKYQEERFLAFPRITPEYIEQFIQYLQVEYENAPTTIRKNLQPIRRVIKRGIKDGFLDKDPFQVATLPKKKKTHQKTKLTIEQIRAIEGLKLKKGSWLWNTRNAFLFSFYSGGIRFGDLASLTWLNVQDGRLIYEMGKNEKGFSTKLNDSQIKILNLYSGAGDQYIFPFLNNSKKYGKEELRKAINSKNVLANKNLRRITTILNEKIEEEKLKVPKINTRISFHVSRHSFAQYAIDNGLSVYDLMQTLRHSKIDTTQQYLKGLNESDADKAMNKLGF